MEGKEIYRGRGGYFGLALSVEGQAVACLLLLAWNVRSEC